MKTVVIKGSDLSYAVDTIMRGGVVAVPTETVYGLAANGLDANAVAKIYELKGRPAVKPLSLLVPGLDAAECFCALVPDSARLLAEAFWPGPLTIVLPSSDEVPDIVRAGGDTIGIRCPNHLKTLALLNLLKVPLAAPSANISNRPSPKNVDDVLSYFDGKIDCIIDGGTCTFGTESTLVLLSSEIGYYKVLRQGVLTEEDIMGVLGYS